VSIADEKRKILDGTYPTKVVAGRQRKHILGTREFAQNLQKMQNQEPKSRPAILIADAKKLVAKYKGTGTIKIPPGSQFPREIVDTDDIIGLTWVESMQKYVDTKRIAIIYSSDGVHVVPFSDYRK